MIVARAVGPGGKRDVTRRRLGLKIFEFLVFCSRFSDFCLCAPVRLIWFWLISKHEPASLPNLFLKSLDAFLIWFCKMKVGFHEHTHTHTSQALQFLSLNHSKLPTDAHEYQSNKKGELSHLHPSVEEICGYLFLIHSFKPIRFLGPSELVTDCGGYCLLASLDCFRSVRVFNSTLSSARSKSSYTI